MPTEIRRPFPLRLHGAAASKQRLERGGFPSRSVWRKQRSREAISRSGFTLVELVTVMAIIGIVAAIAVSRFADRASFDARAFHDETLAILRYAHKAAIAQRRTVCAAFSANSVTLTIAAGNPGTCNTPLAGPTENSPFAVTAQGNAAFSTVPANFSFDSLGRPSSSASILVNGYGGAITVEPETGYVH